MSERTACCSNCESWVVSYIDAPGDTNGECHFEPPTIGHHGGSAWPPANRNEWCRKHERRATVGEAKLQQPQDSRSGIAAVIGKWPGDETDEEIRDALDEPALQACCNCKKTHAVNSFGLCGECSTEFSEFVEKQSKPKNGKSIR